MPTTHEELPVVNEEIWRAWVQKGKVRDQLNARRMKVVVRIALTVFAAVAAYYLLG